jgi:hypothetical protein
MYKLCKLTVVERWVGPGFGNGSRTVWKMGAILKKSVDWSDTDVILSEGSNGKAIVLLQIPEVLNNEAIQVLLCKKIWISKAIVSFQTPEFLKVKR